MTVTPRTFAALIGGIVAAIGFVILALPVSTPDWIGTTDCGSGFITTSEAERCSDALSTRRIIGWPLLGIGMTAIAAYYLVQPARRDDATQPQA